MAREKKDWVNLSMKIDKEISDRVDAMNKDSGIPKTIIVEKALAEYLERYEQTGKIKP